MYNDKKIDVMKKKLAQFGTSLGAIFPATWLYWNLLHLRSEVEMIVTEHYILVKDSRNQIISADEVSILESLEQLRNEKIVEEQKRLKKSQKG